MSLSAKTSVERLRPPNPDSAEIEHYLDPLCDRAGVELRYHDTPMYNSVFRFDDDMFVTPHVFGRPGRLAPLLHLRRRQDDGIFDNYLAHLEDVWATAVPIPAG